MGRGASHGESRVNRHRKSSLILSAFLLGCAARAETPVEVTLADELDESRAGYCLDTRGGRNRAGASVIVHSHSCRSYLGELAEDQTFDADRIAEGIFELMELDVCMTAREQAVGSELTLEPCDGSGAQRFEHVPSGQIVPAGARETCLTVSGGPSRQAGGGDPPHLIRDVSLEPCDSGRENRQRWSLRESPE